ncbi:MAG: DUF2887 domain-containing protein [Candidatus Contendobacter sp.]
MALAPTVANPGSYGFRTEEVKQITFRLDSLLIPPAADPAAPFIFLEAQAQPDDDFYGRFFSEIFLYLYRCNPRPCWRALVLYPRHTIERLDSCYASQLTLPEVRRVYLEDLARVSSPSLGLQLLQLLVAAPRAAAEQARRLAHQLRTGSEPPPLPLAEALDLIETILVYRLPKLTRQEIQAMLGFTHADLKKSVFYQEVFADVIKKTGRRAGRRVGRKSALL